MTHRPPIPAEVHGRTGRHVVVLGLMGVGKSTLGRALAQRLDRTFVDSDTDIKRLTGVSGREYTVANGVEDLHRLEAAVLLGALARDEPAVICAAASVVEVDVVRLALGRRSTVIRLSIDHQRLLERQRTGDHRRAMDTETLMMLTERREPLFAEVEDLHLRADREPGQLVDQVVAHLDRL